MEKDENWVVVYSSDQQHIADMAKQVLEDNNITSVIIDKQDSTFVHPHGYVELLVQKHNEEKALSLIKELLS